MVDLVPLHCPHKDAGLAGLLGQAVVDVGDDGEGGVFWVANAYVNPVVSKTQQETVISCYLSIVFLLITHHMYRYT